jgi:hypothetical protein
MRYLLLSAAAVTLVLASNAAFAQRSTAASSSSAVVSTRSSSASRAAAVGNTGNTVNITNTTGTAGTGSGATDPSYDQYIGYGGGYTVHNVPEVIPPNVVGGNPCAVGASAGLAVSGFGISGGGTWADKQCERRQQAALLYNMGHGTAATELLCQDDHVRAALRAVGEPCTADRPAAAVAAATPQPAPVVRAATVAPALPANTRPDWCWTAGPAELRHHAECNVSSH